MKVHFEVRCRLCDDEATDFLCKSCKKAFKVGLVAGLIAAAAGFPTLQSLLSLF